MSSSTTTTTTTTTNTNNDNNDKNTTVATNEDLELEEGEIADDSNDDDIDDATGTATTTDLATPGEPQKKRRKVVRKVRRKIKVKRKVVKKIPLWEQQILMLQEMQKHQADQQSQILKAAATDEDLRIFGPPLLQAPQLPAVATALASTATPATTAPTTTITTIPPPQTQIMPLAAQPTAQLVPNLHAQMQPPPQSFSNHPQLQQQQQQQQQQQDINNTASLQPGANSTSDQTPGSPDDESGKSSYEAISKMLTLLRNSANITESPSEIGDSSLNQLEMLDSRTKSSGSSISGQQLGGASINFGHRPATCSMEYSLVPILVNGIDYTKYKLLSQFEPKFKNDPRLNQQT